MGIVVHSYALRWNPKVESTRYPGFQNALQLMEHCQKIGAGGVQVGVSNWATDFSKKVRDVREKLGLYLEGSIGLPKSASDQGTFEKEVLAAKEAGATVLRTVCLSGRRYENFRSEADFQAFRQNARQSLRLAAPIVQKHKMKLAVENHKDWRAEELVELIKELSNEWVGVTLDFGNNVSLLEDPAEVIRRLAPYAFSTHVKDMGVQEYPQGFLLSEVPLGQGIVNLKEGVALCQKYNPNITFNLEMITRDPLEVPCLGEAYWATLGTLPASHLASTLRMVRERSFPQKLPSVSGLDSEQRLAFEEQNILSCLAFSKSTLRLGT